MNNKLSLTTRILAVASILLVGAGSLPAQILVTGNITTDQTWTADTTYLLVGQTFVKDGVTLTIEPGTVIKANADDGNGLAPALVIERGARIIADGTASDPITFTSSLDESELPARGTWGGLILLGNAPISKDGGENYVEGLVGIPYGGTDPDDNSGILRYVRVWYGGCSIGQDNEINGITLAGVGRGTAIEHCEVAWNLDDGFEMFGGTVDLKYCSVLFVGDDAFDTDEGYQGRGQFLFAMVGESEGNRAHEMDSKTNSDMDSQPRSMPQFSNVTLVGSGSATASADNDQLIRLREGTAGLFWNYIVVEAKEYGVKITDSTTISLIGDSLQFSANNIVFNNYSGQFADDYGITALNVDPQLVNLDGRESGGTIDPRPALGGPAYENVDGIPSTMFGEIYNSDGFFTQVSYKGAFGTDLWLAGWSWLDANDRLGKSVMSVDDEETAQPTEFALLGNYPNPFNPTTSIRFRLPASINVEVKIYNITGQLVSTITTESLNSGLNSVTWNGTSLTGEAVASGLYFYSVQADGNIRTGKMTLLK